MIKILLKHLIYDKCIDVLFDGIYRNFLSPQELINLRIEKILAVSRRISAKWIFIEEPMICAHGVDIEKELMDALEQEITYIIKYRKKKIETY